MNITDHLWPNAEASRRGDHLMTALTQMAIFALIASASVARAEADRSVVADTLAVVNGEAITSQDLEEMIMGRHQSGDPSAMVNRDLRRLVDKAIHDRLILQEALVMGLDAEPAVIIPVEERLAAGAVKAFAADQFPAPPPVSEDQIRRTFERSYWKMQLRQVSAETEAQARELRARVRQGESMEQLAVELSIDPRRISGGLHRTKYWADVEDALKDPVRGLEVGELSDVFPYGAGWSFARIEEKVDVDPADFGRFEGKIRGILTTQAQEVAWEGWIETLQRELPVRVDDQALNRLRADQGALFQAAFLKESDQIALSIDPEHVVTEGELRRAVSHQAMNDGTAAFEVVLQRGIDELSEKLVLRTRAEQMGYYERAELMAQYHRDLEQSMLEMYLEEVIASRIRFKREEFQEFYEEHAEEFRGPEEFRLAMFVVQDEEQAREAAERLAGGADFDFVRRQYTSEHGAADSKWTPIELFSSEIKDAVLPLDVGQTTPAIDTAAGWVLIRVDGRRPGAVRPMEEVEMPIRQALFQRKFNELLDEHIKLLKEHSEIVVYEDRIESYFTSESR
jgi:parvulin-like peptidyl-prolyl isomerase